MNQDPDFLAENFSKSCSVQFMKHGNELKDERCPVISVKIDNALVYKNIEALCSASVEQD